VRLDHRSRSRGHDNRDPRNKTKFRDWTSPAKTWTNNIRAMHSDGCTAILEASDKISKLELTAAG
jgi:hypothetical protein